MTLQTQRVQTLEQVHRVAAGEEPVQFEVLERASAYSDTSTWASAPSVGIAPYDEMYRRGRLSHPFLADPTGVLGAHGDDDSKLRRDDVEPLGAVLWRLRVATGLRVDQPLQCLLDAGLGLLDVRSSRARPADATDLSAARFELPAPLANRRARRVVPGGDMFADLALRQRRIRVGERLEDSPLRGVGPRRSIGGVDPAQAHRMMPLAQLLPPPLLVPPDLIV